MTYFFIVLDERLRMCSGCGYPIDRNTKAVRQYNHYYDLNCYKKLFGFIKRGNNLDGSNSRNPTICLRPQVFGEKH